jgi:hypothetical protein
MLHPHMRQVLPLAPEPVANTDGHRKQDCELAAAKRILPKIRTAHPRLPIIITADGLYSDQPFVDALKKAGMSFILVAKPTDHKLLFEWVNELSGLGGGWGSLGVYRCQVPPAHLPLDQPGAAQWQPPQCR